LVDFVYNITKGKSLLICGYVMPYAPSDKVYVMIRQLNETIRDWLKKRRIKAFFDCTANTSIRNGAQSMIQMAGLGKLRPNILFLGFKQNWAEKGLEGLNDTNEYFGIIQ
jgi:hypothetical protein